MYNVSIAFCENRKIAHETFLRLKRKTFQYPSFEGKRINFGASKPKLRRFEIWRFCDQLRPFLSCLPPSMQMYVCMHVCMCSPVCTTQTNPGSTRLKLTRVRPDFVHTDKYQKRV